MMSQMEYREAIRVDPDDAEAHNNLALLLETLKRYDEAELEYREAIRADPNFAAAHNSLGFRLEDRGRYDEAELEYREAIRADPNLAAAHYYLGVLLETLKRYDESEMEYREAIQADPNFAVAHVCLGLLFLKTGRPEEAEKERRAAIQADPNLAGCIDLSFLETERREEAKKEFNTAKGLNGVVDTMDNQTLSPEEQEELNTWMVQMESEEMAQVQDMVENCNVTFSFAKTHSNFVKDWEKSKQKLENDLKNGNIPPNISTNFFRASIDATDEIMQRKQEKARDAFQEKFGESIYNYIGFDGKTENITSAITLFAIAIAIILFLAFVVSRFAAAVAIAGLLVWTVSRSRGRK